MLLLIPAIAAAALLTSCGSKSDDATAANYPTKSISVICPWAAGGGTDRVARFVAAELQQRLGQPVIVVNKTGGSGAVGHAAGALAKPDGYTVTMGTFELSTMHRMGISELTWESFQPLIQVNADAAAVIVRKDAPWNSLSDWLDFVRKNPGKLKMSGTATGGAWDLARAGFLLAAGLKVDSVLWVPTQGSAPSIVELLGGHIDAVCCSVPEAASQIEAGQLKVLGVMAPERLPEFPDVKTAKEQGIDWEAVGWRGLLLPKGTPPAILERLHSEARAIIQSDQFKSFMKKNGFAIAARGPEEFTAFLKEQDARWQRVIAAAGYARK